MCPISSVLRLETLCGFTLLITCFCEKDLPYESLLIENRCRKQSCSLYSLKTFGLMCLHRKILYTQADSPFLTNVKAAVSTLKLFVKYGSQKYLIKPILYLMHTKRLFATAKVKPYSPLNLKSCKVMQDSGLEASREKVKPVVRSILQSASYIFSIEWVPSSERVCCVYPFDQAFHKPCKSESVME